MLDRYVGIACQQPQVAANVPAASKTRVKRQCPVDQRYHSPNVLAEIRQRHRRIRKDARIIARHLQSPPGKIGTLMRIRLGIIAPTVLAKPKAAYRGPGEGGPVTRIARD